MARQPYQVLVLPFIAGSTLNIEYAVFRRSDHGYWQGIAGGGEDDEMPADTARREAEEEGGISPCNDYYQLETVTYVERSHFMASTGWDKSIVVVPSFSFAVSVSERTLRLSKEHSRYKWMQFDEAYEKLYWHGNKTALWELNYRLTNGLMPKTI